MTLLATDFSVDKVTPKYVWPEVSKVSEKFSEESKSNEVAVVLFRDYSYVVWCSQID